MDWDKASLQDITAWCNLLCSGIQQYHVNPTTGAQIAQGLPAPCQFDLDNLHWSGQAILNSIELSLWETIEKETRTDGDGPLVFAHIVLKLQQVSASAICTLVQELESKLLAQVPGHDIEVLSDELTKLCRKIEGAGIPPPDLASLVAKTFL